MDYDENVIAMMGAAGAQEPTRPRTAPLTPAELDVIERRAALNDHEDSLALLAEVRRLQAPPEGLEDAGDTAIRIFKVLPSEHPEARDFDAMRGAALAGILDRDAQWQRLFVGLAARMDTAERAVGDALADRVTADGYLDAAREELAAERDARAQAERERNAARQREAEAVRADRTEELAARLASAESALAAARADVVAAAGELLVRIPPPGTDLAKLLIANAIMRRERGDAQKEARDLRAEVERLRSSVEEAAAKLAAFIDRHDGDGNDAANEVDDAHALLRASLTRGPSR